MIKHARKSLLFNHGRPWIKNNIYLMLPWVAMHDGAEICELVGLFILNHLGKKFGKKNIGLYRDDGLAIIKNRSARLADKSRKKLHKVFEQFGPKITAESNLHVVSFLEVTFDLATGKYKPYRKPNDDPLYIHKHQLSTSAFQRCHLTNKYSTMQYKHIKTHALGHSSFSHKLEYMPHVTQQPRRNRQRNIIWFNPPFSKNVKTNIVRSFLKLIDTHFPIGNKLHKIFNRNTVKVSYSCMSNVKSIITSHNTRIIRKS